MIALCTFSMDIVNKDNACNKNKQLQHRWFKIWNIKGANTCDKLEHEHEEAHAKEILTKVEVNNKKLYTDVE